MSSLQSQVAALKENLSTQKTELLKQVNTANARADDMKERASSREASLADANKVNEAKLQALKNDCQLKLTQMTAQHEQFKKKFQQQAAEAKKGTQSMEDKLHKSLEEQRITIEKRTLQEINEITMRLQQEHGRAFAKAQAETEAAGRQRQQELDTANEKVRMRLARLFLLFCAGH